MSYCPNCGRRILDESLGCPVCNVRNNTDPGKTVIEGQAEEVKREEKAETVEHFTVEDSNGEKHHFENNTETGNTEYVKEEKNPAEATIHPALKVMIVVLIVMVGGFGAIAGCVAGLVLSKSPSEDYRRFGKLMLTVSIVVLALSLLCCVMTSFLGGLSYMITLG